MNDEVLTIPEVSQFLKVSEETVRRWIKRGKLPALQFDRKYRIRKKDIMDRFKVLKQNDEK